MRLIHTADLHFGQMIYHHYDRLDEHLHFFRQLRGWIKDYIPDVLVLSGDIYDVAQPPASVWAAFNNEIVSIRREFSDLHIVIVAGNHDSAARIHSHSEVWDVAGVTVIGTPPPYDLAKVEGWEERFIVRLKKGYVIAVPYIAGDRTEAMVRLQEYVERENSAGLPVVMTGHLAATGCDTEGHSFDIGTLRTVPLDRFGSGYDYLALGHIHKPQTLGYSRVFDEDPHTYPSPVARYSGSVLHVSDDEAYPHTVSLVDLDRRGGAVTIRELRIEQLRHFRTIPTDPAVTPETEKELMKELKKFLKNNDGCYFRLRMSSKIDLPADFTNQVYEEVKKTGKDLRFNPRPIFVSPIEEGGEEHESEGPQFEVEELTQMENPFEFVRMTAANYPGLDLEEMRRLFEEIEARVKINAEEV